MNRSEEELVAAVRTMATAREQGLCDAPAFMAAAAILLTVEGLSLEQMTELVTLAHRRALGTPWIMNLASEMGGS